MGKKRVRDSTEVYPREGKRWTREEVLIALHLYWRTPFGQQTQRNREIIQVAQILGRSPDSVSMKLNNLTSLDPIELARGIKGLQGASNLDRHIWVWAANNQALAAAEMEELWQRHVEMPPNAFAAMQSAAVLPTYAGTAGNTASTTMVRRGQEFFRRAVLANFQETCAITGITGAKLLRASHIVGWAESEAHRVNPRNGLALNALHDAAFDQHLLSFDEDLRLLVGKKLRDTVGRSEFATHFLSYQGKPLREAYRTPVDRELIALHRQAFLLAEAG